MILGEFSVVRRNKLKGKARELHLASGVYFNEVVTRQALAHGLIPFYWDNGHAEHGSAIFNRKNNTVVDQAVLDGLLRGAR